MHFLKVVEVDESLVDRAWQSVSGLGGYYSIADGITKDIFRRMLFGSAVVLEAPNLMIRLQAWDDYLEVHPVAFGPSVFAAMVDSRDGASSESRRDGESDVEYCIFLDFGVHLWSNNARPWNRMP